MGRREKKKKGGIGNVISTLILIIAIGIFAFAAWNLITIYLNYKTGVDEYAKLEEYADNQKITEGLDDTMEENDTMGDEWGDAELTEHGCTSKFEVMENPIDFEGLQKINPDVIGWLEMEAVDTINYPITQGEDNDYYLHRTFQKTDNFAGSIFLDYMNKSNFGQRNSVVYGHNMKNGSMFGSLKKYRDEEVYKTSPYFWIYTPTRIYKYEIFSCSEVDKYSTNYQITFRDKEDFQEFIYSCEEQALYDTGVDVDYTDTILTLSTCTGNEATRFIVQGKRVRTYAAVPKAGGYETEVQE